MVNDMTALHIAVVSDDPDIRLEAARAFDEAPPSWSVTLHTTVPDEADIVVLGPDARGEGIPFDPSKPHRLIDEIGALTAKRDDAVIVVTAVSGGVGTTSLALHLAAAIAPGLAVGFVELAPGAGARLGFNPGEHLTWAELDDSIESRARCFIPVAPGFRVLLAPDDDDDPGLALKRARGAFDLLIVDTPPQHAAEVFSEADAGVVVMAPTVPQAQRVKAALEDRSLPDLAVVTNRLGRGGETTRTQLSRLLDRPIALELPCSPALRDAEDDGRLISLKWTRYGRAVARLADALVTR
jgi:cellulose biosynthesis protein BcsQ